MTILLNRGYRRDCAGALVIALLVLAAEAGTAETSRTPELGAILARSAVQPPASVRFSEERHNPMFSEPMVLEGHLEYIDKGVLRKVIETPFAEDILVESGQLVVARDGQTRRLPLNRSRALKTILGAIEAVLSGDLATLEASFRCELSGDDDAWVVHMTPLSRSVERRLSALEISGDGRAVTNIRIELPGNEWHLMSIGHPLPAAHGDPHGQP